MIEETADARRFERRVRGFMASESLWPERGGLLLAVSGGQDSTALLLALARLAPRRRIALAAAHFDHGLRGRDAAARELGRVRSLCSDLGVSLVEGGADVRARAREVKASLENAARICRYEFLAAAAGETACRRVATGHTASDQAETLLLHLLRGSGLRGLAGMAALAAWPLPGHADLALVRPLLGRARAETFAYCRARGVEPLEDESNLSPEFARNRVRHEVLPLLRELNPRIEQALARLAGAAGADDALLDGLAAELVERSAGASLLSRSALASVPPALAARALSQAFESLSGSRQGLSEAHIASLQRLVRRGKTGDSLDLPRGVRAELTRDGLSLSLEVAGPPALPREAVCLGVPGERRYGHLDVAARAQAAEGFDEQAAVAADSVAGGVRVRRRQPGDRFQPLGMEGTKKLQDFFVDSHVPRAERDAVPVFESPRGIVWVGGLRVAEWARPRPGEATVTLCYRIAPTSA